MTLSALDFTSATHVQSPAVSLFTYLCSVSMHALYDNITILHMLYTSVKQSTTAKAVINKHRVLGVMCHNLASSVSPYLCIAIISQQHEGMGW